MKKLLATTAAAFMLTTGGIALASPGDGAGPPPEHKARFEEALKKLPEDKAELVRAAFKEMREEHKSKWQSHKGERDAMKALLTAPEFDKAAFLNQARDMANKHVEMRVKGAERIADLATKLNQEERKVLAEMMPKKGKHKKRRGKRKDD